MKVLIAGGGIGGLATALCAARAGIDAEIFEQTNELRELGVGINMLPHAIKELAALGLLPELDAGGNPHPRTDLYEPFGPDGVARAARHRCRLRDAAAQHPSRQAAWRAASSGARASGRRPHSHRPPAGRFSGSAPVKSSLRLSVATPAKRRGGRRRADRRGRNPLEGPVALLSARGPAGLERDHALARSGRLADLRDGRTMVIAGGNEAKFVFYPIHVDPAKPDIRLTNWAIMARIGDGSAPPPRREDWKSSGQVRRGAALRADRFRLGFVEPVELIEATGTFYEYPACDRDPLPRWSFGRATLLGDAAHPMYPVGSNGASQAILDARALARHLASGNRSPRRWRRMTPSAGSRPPRSC